MSALAWLIPCALILGGIGLVGFLWTLKADQYRDLEGAAWRALDDEPPAKNDTPGSPTNNTRHPEATKRPTETKRRG